MAGVDVCLTFDTTGSMYPCLTQVRRNVEDLIKRLFRDVEELRIAIIAHGDYCDEGNPYVLKYADFTGQEKDICQFVRTVEKTGGGDSPECYELALNQARLFAWRADSKKILVVIGDDVPHEPNYPMNTKRLDWRKELRGLVGLGVNVYGVHAMPGIRQHSRRFYQEIAKETGGFYLTLDQFAAITDIIFAVCYQQSSAEQLRTFQGEVQRAGRMSRNMADVFSTLGGSAVHVSDVPDGLVPVPAGRFQVLNVDAEMAIRDFVEANGLSFQKGRGFYEFMKTETIQEKKEVVLMNAAGDMFTGAEAREMIGLPFGMRGRIRPDLVRDYVVFVQSTSYNRKLVRGTRFLYEVEDWSRD